MTDQAPEREHERGALPSRSSSGTLVGGILGMIESAITNRPRPMPQIEERYSDPWATLNGMTVDGIDKPVERPEPPDRSGARL